MYTYIITVVNTVQNSGKSNYRYVTFSFLAQITLHPEDTHVVYAGDTAIFTCVASGKPLPSIAWKRNDVELNNNDSQIIITEQFVTEEGITLVKSYLEICSAAPGDAARYSCTAENEIAMDTFSFNVTVKTEGRD